MGKKKYQISSVACIVRKGDSYLFCKREDNGLWELPGGQVESGEDPMKAALRELAEETGLQANEVRLKVLWHFNLYFEQKLVGVYQVIGKIRGQLTPSWETPKLTFMELKHKKIRVPLYIVNLLNLLDNSYSLQYVNAGPFDIQTAMRYIYGKTRRCLRHLIRIRAEE